MMIVRIVTHSILALIVGSFISLYRMQDQAWLKETLQARLQQEFGNAFECSMECSLTSLNFFYPSFELRDVKVIPRSGNAWQWHADCIKVKCHWLYMLLYKDLDADMVVDNFQASSLVYDGSCAIVEDHFNKLLFGAPFTITMMPRTITFNNAAMEIYDQKHAYHVRILCDSYTQKQAQGFTTQIKMQDGNVTMDTATCMEHFVGDIELACTFQGDDIDKVTTKARCSSTIPALSHKKITGIIDGNWQGQEGSFSLQDEKGSFGIGPVIIKKEANTYTADGALKIPIGDAFFIPSAVAPLVPDALAGTIHASVAHDGSTGTLQGSFSPNNTTAHSIAGNFVVNKQRDQWKGACGLDLPYGVHANATYAWDQALGTGSSTASFAQEATQHMFMHLDAEQKTWLELHADQKGNAHGSFGFHGIYQATEQKLAVTGVFKKIGSMLDLKGVIQGHTYALDLKLEPTITVQKFSFGNDKPLIELSHAGRDNVLTGSIAMKYIKDYVARWSDSTLGQEGTVMLEIALQDPLRARIKIADAAYKFPHIYNVVHEVMADMYVDFAARELSLKDVRCSLYKGAVECQHALFRFDSSYALNFAHIPIVFNNCLLNVHKDLFAILSGAFTVGYDGRQPSIKGNCIIDHAQLTENIFSTTFQRRLSKYMAEMTPHYNAEKMEDIACDIAVATFSPIHIKTAFLETDAKVNLHIKSSLKDPEITGDILLTSGSLFFPYKPLHIVKGALHFTPHNVTDPFIELVAKNSIKKHMVNLHISGYVHDPHIMLFSSPSLTQEQIISLLLVGSTQGSLSLVMPVLLANSITTLLFADDQSPHAVDRYFKNLLKPFKSIHLVPSLSDQTGRGGLRGAIEVEVNDRLHALIQKNFSLSEDTRFELEYLVSDEISLKAFRDERRDVGGEVEMKWKF